MSFEACCETSNNLIDFFIRYIQPLFRTAMSSIILDGVMRMAIALAALALAWWLIREGIGKNKSPCAFCPVSPNSKLRGPIVNNSKKSVLTIFMSSVKTFTRRIINAVPTER